MDNWHADLLLQYRSKFVQSMEVERLYPMLVKTKTLSDSETDMLDMLPTEQDKVGRLLDMLPKKGRRAFQSFCLALETTYPHLLTVMFLGSTSTLPMAHKGTVKLHYLLRLVFVLQGKKNHPLHHHPRHHPRCRHHSVTAKGIEIPLLLNFHW